MIEGSDTKAMEMRNTITARIELFHAKCKERDPGMELDIKMIGFDEYIVSTINSEKTTISYSFILRQDGTVDIARIM